MGERENGEPSMTDEEETIYTHNNVNQHKQEEKEEEELKIEDDEKSLYDVVSDILLPIFSPDSKSTSSFFQRTKDSFRHNLPNLRDASRNSGFKLLNWARQGSPIRLLFVISVGTITLLTLTGILVFLLFLAAATTNAIILSLFVSLAAAGGALAIFFACVAAIYIGALSVAVFVISSVTLSAIMAILIVSGWIGFFWILWAAMRKSVGIAKHSASITGSVLSAIPQNLYAKRHHHD